MKYSLNQIRSLKKANVPASLEFDAAEEEVKKGWAFDATLRTAKLGLSVTDMITLHKLHNHEKFHTPVTELAEHIVSHCEMIVAKRNAQ